MNNFKTEAELVVSRQLSNLVFDFVFATCIVVLAMLGLAINDAIKKVPVVHPIVITNVDYSCLISV